MDLDFYDYRPADLQLDRLNCKAGNLLALPFESGSVLSLSCMHVLEHIGLGRYGDPMDVDGDRKAAAELTRVLAPGGDFLMVVPVGRPRVCFNAHRIYDYERVLALFSELELVEFSLVEDDLRGGAFHRKADPDLVAQQEYGCGCFHFRQAD
jgi:SAM-dependent methyltransferase